VVESTRQYSNSTRAAIAGAVNTAKPCCVNSAIALYFVRAAWRQEGNHGRLLCADVTTRLR